MASRILDLIEKANASLGRNAQEEARKKRGQQAPAKLPTVKPAPKSNAVKDSAAQLLSSHDLTELSMGSQNIVREAKADYDRAKAAGDRAGMAAAHEKAESARRQHGYSGGVTGSEYIAPELSAREKIMLTEEGEQQLRRARMENDSKREEEVLNAQGYREYTNYAKNKKKREQAEAALKAAGTGVAGSLLSLSETARQAMRNYQQDRWGMLPDDARRTVDPNLLGQRLLQASGQYAKEATAGKNDISRFLTETAISGTQMLPSIAASFIPGIGPAVGAGIMGAQAAGSKAYEVNTSGAEAGEAMTRGLLSGGIEGLTERMGLSNLVKIVNRAGGASFLKNVAQQAGIEATEESASYVLNLAADVAAENPNAQVSLSDFINGMADQFSFSELAQNAAAGALLGGTFAGAGTAINRAITNPTQTPQESPDNPLLRASGFYDRRAEKTPEEMQEAPTVGTGEDYTMERDENGITYVQINADILNGLPQNEWGKKVRDTIQKIFEHGVVLPRGTIFSNRKGRGEYSNGAYTRMLERTDPDMYADKLRMSAGAEGLVRSAANVKYEDANHDRKDDIVGFNRGNIMVSVKDSGYEGDLLTAIYADGKETFFDVNSLKRKKISKAPPERYAADSGFTQAEDTLLNTDSGTQAPDAFSPGNTSDTSLASLPSADYNMPQTPPEVNDQNLPEGQGAMSRGGAGDFATWQSETPGNQFHPVNEQGSELAEELYGRASVEIPTRDPRGMLTSKTVSTLANAGISNNQLVESLEQDAVSGGYSYTAYSDAQAKADAEAKIRDMGYQAARDQWIADAKAGKLSKENTALGLTLINNAANSGTLEGHIDAHNLIGYYISYARTAGQALQAMNMVNKMTPTGQLYSLVKTTENLALDIKERTGKEVDFTIDPELSRRFMEAETQEARDEIRKDIYKDIAQQVPNTFLDKANAWRYLAMLGNPRTHFRNIFGSLFFDPVRATKNLVAAGIERAAGVKDRTKAVTSVFSAEDRARYRAAQADFLDVQEAVMSGGKYNDDWSQIDEYRTIFKNPLLEKARKGNAGALEAEDWVFSRRAYADSLSGWLKANGFTGEEYLSGSFDPAEKDRARQYAIKEAQKATYRDLNAASELVLSLGNLRNSPNKAKRAAGIFVEGVLPFKKTPTNILVRGLEYSPAGLTKGIVDAVVNVRNGKMEAAEAIDEIAAGLTGTGLLALGAGLAAAGMATGGASGDDKHDEFNELQGYQNYALEVGDTSYTIDWLAPEALPFFVGVELYKFVSGLESGETEKKDWAKAVTRIAEPMLEMSMLQSLNDVINSVGSDVPLVSAIASSAMSYLGQFVPTLGGQIERAFLEDTRQSTFVDRDSVIPTSAQYMLGTIGNKIPGIEFQQRDYVDAWGRTESTGDLKTRAFSNFFSPGYISQINSTGVDRELQRLYDAGYDAVFPSMTQTNKQVADRTSGEEGAKRYLTAEEYLTMQTVKGQTSFDILDTVFRSDSYKAMSDTEKAALVERAYDYASQMSNLAVDSEYDTSRWVENVAKAGEVGLSAGQFFEALNKNAEIDKREGVKNNQKAFEFEDWINKNPDYTDEQKKFLKDNIKIWTSIPADPSKYHKGANAGLTMDQINQAADAYSAADSQYGDGNGSVKQGELYQAIKALGLSDEESAILYNQAKPSNWKATWYTSKRS